jgi:type I restriction enzyme S subunit
MSRIDELIKEYCPYGVEYKELVEVCKFEYGKGNNIPKNGGDHPVYGCNGIVSFTDKYNNENSAIIGHIGSAGVVNWGKGKHFVTYNGTMCNPKTKDIDSKYIYYTLLTLKLDKRTKGSQTFLSYGDIEKIKVAIPPIQVQEEIVKILDNITNLTAELEAELESRKKQYEYYRNKLLDFSETRNTLGG